MCQMPLIIEAIGKDISVFLAELISYSRQAVIEIRLALDDAALLVSVEEAPTVFVISIMDGMIA